MAFKKFGKSVYESIRGAGWVVHQTVMAVKSHPQILIYPYSALFFVSITYPLISVSIVAHWYNRIFSEADSVTPHSIGAVLGLVGFSAFYSAIVTAYFTCATSAGTLAQLEGRSVAPHFGLMQVINHFSRVTKFAFLSLFFFPLGIYTQRDKLPKGIIGVLGSSLTLHMAQVAPAILSTKKTLLPTIMDSINTLGKAWRQGLVLKIGMYLFIFLIVLMPKIIQHGFFKDPSASNISWLISLGLATSSYVTFKVVNSIFTTVLYHQASKK